MQKLDHCRGFHGEPVVITRVVLTLELLLLQEAFLQWHCYRRLSRDLTPAGEALLSETWKLHCKFCWLKSLHIIWLEQ